MGEWVFEQFSNGGEDSAQGRAGTPGHGAVVSACTPALTDTTSRRPVSRVLLLLLLLLLRTANRSMTHYCATAPLITTLADTPATPPPTPFFFPRQTQQAVVSAKTFGDFTVGMFVVCRGGGGGPSPHFNKTAFSVSTTDFSFGCGGQAMRNKNYTSRRSQLTRSPRTLLQTPKSPNTIVNAVSVRGSSNAPLLVLAVCSRLGPAVAYGLRLVRTKSPVSSKAAGQSWVLSALSSWSACLPGSALSTHTHTDTQSHRHNRAPPLSCDTLITRATCTAQ